MGRFETTVEFYSRYREPYPPEFFAEAAREIPLDRTERLLDIACGPAPLAIGFTPYVSSCIGVDPEPGMIASAREQAAKAGITLNLVESRFEDLPAAIGTFDIATIGRALHWIDREAGGAAFDRFVPVGGCILTCAALASRGPVNPWSQVFQEIRRAATPDEDEKRYHIKPEDWFAGSRFRKAEDILVKYTHQVTITDLVNRALSLSTLSPAVLGARRPAFEAELAKALEPFAKDGRLTEEVEVTGTVFR